MSAFSFPANFIFKTSESRYSETSESTGCLFYRVFNYGSCHEISRRLQTCAIKLPCSGMQEVGLCIYQSTRRNI
jgi:hypothetical protein